MKIIKTTNIDECIYDRAIAIAAKDRDIIQETDAPNEVNAILGANVHDPRVKQTLGPNTYYVFWLAASGALVACHVTAREKTLRNFRRQERKFGHIRPEAGLW